MTTCACGCGAFGLPAAAVPNKNILVEPPTEELLTLDEAKLRAGLDWPAGDPRDAQMELFIKAARERVERDTGLALRTQTREVYLSHLVLPADFPAPAHPLQSIEAVVTVDAEGRRYPRAWTFGGGRLRVEPVVKPEPPDWPLLVDDVYPWIVRIVVGWPKLEDIPPLLQWAVGLLTAHYATVARDAVVVGTIAQTVPLGYDEALSDYRRVAV